MEEKLRSRNAIKQGQTNWADSLGLAPDATGYLAAVKQNLFRPLSASAQAAFEQGSGAELLDTPCRPAKMKALHSSSALAVNVFDYWSGSDPEALGTALGLSDAIARITFEAQYPTGLPGNPPNLDVVLELVSAKQFAIESKFTEWLPAKSTAKQPFKDKYFESSAGEWSQRGLEASQQLAEQMQHGEVTFRHLDAAQLLKHALGLATQLGDGFSLGYLYFDWPCAEGELHRREIGQFAAAVDDSLEFKAMSYQEFYVRLREACGDEHAEYLSYLGQRYFPEGPL